MKRIFILFFAAAFFLPTVNAQSPITATSVATFNAYAGEDPEPTVPYATDLGVRRVIVADVDLDGVQEVIATDYSNGGRVHVMKLTSESTLEIVWSSPVSTTTSGSTPRFPQVGDCDGDGLPEIIFEQAGEGRMVFYEWDGISSWGTEPAFEITSANFAAAIGLPTALMRYNRETLLVKDLDGDGKSEIIGHSFDNSGRNVYVLSVDGDLPGFASLVAEGGVGVPNGINWATGSYWSSTPADIDGDGQVEIINHHWDNFGMWAIKVDGVDSYTYPDTTQPGFYNRYASTDALSYFGLAAVDVNGDGRDEIAGTMYQYNHDLCLFQFQPYDTGTNLFSNNPDSVAKRFAIIAKKTDLAALAGKTAAEFWPCVKGDVNQDGMEEIYTGGGRGLNVIAIQYKGTGDLLDPNSYVANLVYTGEGGDVFATINIYHGAIDTIIVGEDTSYVFDPSIVDTTFSETPFTSYVYADNVDLDQDGNMEIVISEQSVYFNTIIVHWVWVDSTNSWERDFAAQDTIPNEYRKTVRVLEYTGTTGFVDQDYNVVTPDDYVLEHNYPNPFNPNTLIKFTLPVQKNISLKIYDMLGREVATLINNQVYEKGNFEIIWNGTNNFGSKVASGNYIATLTFGNFSKSIKMTLLK